MDKKPWYKRPLVWALIVIIFWTWGSIFSSDEPAQASPQPAAAVKTTQPVLNLDDYKVDTQTSQASQVELSNDNYYTNVDGNQIHSPAYAPSVPAGATARCRDGTYSFSQYRSGTCSHHGGVASWL